jgi:tetratricopeptide (TPR) repeat protein
LGRLAYEHGYAEEVRRYLEQALPILHAASESEAEEVTLRLLITVAEKFERCGEAMRVTEQVLAAFVRAVALKPGKAPYWDWRGQAPLGLARYEEALAAYDWALALDRNEPAFWDGLGHALIGLSRCSEALGTYEQALAHAAERPTSWNGRGDALLGLGRRHEALSEGNDLRLQLTGKQAARLLGASPRTAQRRAQEAAARGDRQVRRIGYYWVAPKSWWRSHLAPKPMGRPRKQEPQESASRARSE